jgi:hypothetical protein
MMNKLAACFKEMFQYSPGRTKEAIGISSGSLCPVKIQSVHLTNIYTTELNWLSSILSILMTGMDIVSV